MAGAGYSAAEAAAAEEGAALSRIKNVNVPYWPDATPPTRVGPTAPTAEPPVVKPTPTIPGTTVETLAPGQVADDFVRNLAAKSDAVVLRAGRYVMIGRSLYAVTIVGGIAFLVYDTAMRGPIYAVRDFAIAHM